MNINPKFPVAVLALSLSAAAVAAPYQSKQGFRITPPAGYANKGTLFGTDVIFINRSRASLNVVVRPVPPGTRLDSLRPLVRQVMSRAVSNYKPLGEGTMTLNGERALTTQSAFTAGTPPQPVRGFSVLALHRGKFYFFSCGAPAASFARALPGFKKSIASVRWTK